MIARRGQSLPVTTAKWEGGIGSERRPHKHPLSRTPQPWEFELLRLIAEQGAIPFDQLARFLGGEQEQAARVAKHLTYAGYADYGRFLMDEPPWVWLRRRGARFSGTGLWPVGVKVGAIARMRAVNEVRLHIANRAPEARWVSGRTVVREQGKRGRRPNAVVEIGSERHAIVVKHGVPQELERERTAIEDHMAGYDAVICFANPRPRALLERFKAEYHWPKLVIRPIPGAN